MLRKLSKGMKIQTDEQGFTLVELIVVLAILAVLTALVVPKYGSVLSDSKSKAHNANIEMIESAVEVCYANGGFTSAELNGTKDLMAVLQTKGYLKNEDITDPTDSDKKYSVTALEDNNKLSEIKVSTINK